MAKVGKAGALRRRQRALPTPDERAAIEALARTGRHAEAIERVSALLDDSHLDAGARLDLHDLRAESRSALARMDDAAADVDAMGALARIDGSPAFRVRAINCSVRFHMRRDNRRALEEASEAVKAAKKIDDRALVATSVSLLAEAQARVGDHDAALATSRRAIGLFEQLGDIARLGRAHWVNGLVHLMAGRHDEARASATAALEAGRSTGDFYGIGNAMNLLMAVDTDLASAMRLGQEAIDAFERAGYVNQRAMMAGNVAILYERLGLLSTCATPSSGSSRGRTIDGFAGIARGTPSAISSAPKSGCATSMRRVRCLPNSVGRLPDLPT